MATVDTSELDTVAVDDLGHVRVNGQLIVDLGPIVRDDVKQDSYSYLGYLLPHHRLLVSAVFNSFNLWYIVDWHTGKATRLPHPSQGPGPVDVPALKRLAVAYPITDHDGAGRFIVGMKRQLFPGPGGQAEMGPALLTVTRVGTYTLAPIVGARDAFLVPGGVVATLGDRVQQLNPPSTGRLLGRLKTGEQVIGLIENQLVISESQPVAADLILRPVGGGPDRLLSSRAIPIAPVHSQLVWIEAPIKRRGRKPDREKVMTYRDGEIVELNMGDNEPSQIQDSIIPGRGPIIYAANGDVATAYQDGHELPLNDETGDALISEERVLAGLYRRTMMTAVAPILPAALVRYLGRAA